MSAWEILKNGSSDPEEVRRLQDAFHLAWAELVPNHYREDDREKLAHVIVGLAQAGRDLDPSRLKAAAVLLFAEL